MTSLSRFLAPAAFLSSLFAAAILSPAPAAAEPAGRAVAECRAAMLGQFPDGEVRSFRIADIREGRSGTRVSFFVTADRRYRFDCAADREGRVASAAFDPRRGTALASGR